MCGLAGFIFTQRTNPVPLLKNMLESLKHRGPDDHGIWVAPNCKFALGHTRLSILDLSQCGHQPMVSVSGRYVIAFNGEIYNHRKLRDELSEVYDCEWRGHSDTETLLACIDTWGLRNTLSKCVGMFAIALWDQKEQELTLIRDRYGEKPLYYGNVAGDIVFASQLSAFTVIPSFDRKIDTNALAQFLRFSCVPDPYSIYQGISKLEPGCYVTFDKLGRKREKIKYWSLSDTILTAKSNAPIQTYSQALSNFDTLMSDAVQNQMNSDVPLGAFLSGGIDSSLVVALMQKQSMQKVSTFSIGSNSANHNEAQHAKEVARHLSTDHTELYVNDKEALEVIPKLAQIYDEPFADASQIPTFLVSRMAKKQVTVVLSGDGGDELFGGYNRYLFTNSWWKRISRVPLPLRRLVAASIQGLTIETWNRLFGDLLEKRFVNPGQKLHKGAEVLTSRTVDDLYFGLVSRSKEPEKFLSGGVVPESLFSTIGDTFRAPNALSSIEKMMYRDSLSYLPWDILTKVDRASMAVSLEARVPFLDHRLAEFAWGLPVEYKIRKGVGKSILRDTLYSYVPKELIDRPKMGFGIPLVEWLQGPLRDWAEALLSEESLSRSGVFETLKLRRIWSELLKGENLGVDVIWSVLMFQSWNENVRSNLNGSACFE